MLKLRRTPIDTWRQGIAYLHHGCTGVRARDYLGPDRVEIAGDGHRVRATLNVVEDEGIVGPDEVGLSPYAFERLGLAEGTLVTLERAHPPESQAALRSKIAGAELDADTIDAVIADIVAERYSGREIAALLVASAARLSTAEVLGLARARARHVEGLHWPEPVVVDKHSIGGVPGNRVTMVVVPIVAAHGLIIPKASSRAITSAAGTADTMEVLARVDLEGTTVRRVVSEAHGCIVWNGRLNHSPVDDVMNSVTRPLGIDSGRLSVASILSKKRAAGASHVVIDIPVGPTAKVRSDDEAREMAALFEEVGTGLGMAVTTRLTDGSRPIGNGVGPALEARDVMRVLDNDPEAPADLREKSLAFAATLLAVDPEVGVEGGLDRARELLASGAARATMDRIIELQGRNPDPPGSGPLTRDIPAPATGVIQAIDCWRINGIARSAGAPSDKGAGIDLLKRVGDRVSEGEILYRLHSNAEADLRFAYEEADEDNGYAIGGGD